VASAHTTEAASLQAFAPGEALYGMKDIIGQPVAAVLAEIGKRYLCSGYP
jgi:hypothetical protein